MTTFYILLAFFFVLLNAFFVMAEFAIVKIRHTQVLKLEHTTGIKGKILSKIHERLDNYLSACQLGITLASLGLGWVGEPAFAELLHPLFVILNIHSEDTIEFLSFLTAFSIISYLHIVVGELMPKSMAIRQTELLSLWTAVPLYLFYWLMYPAIWVLNHSSNILLKLFKLDKTKEGLSYSTDEINYILRTSHRYGEFDKSEFELLSKSLKFTDLKISAVMRPLSEMTALNIDDSIEKNLEIIFHNRYSRYPIYKDTPDNIIGILHIKDLLSVTLDVRKLESFAQYMRSILIVKDTDYLLDVFHLFRKGKPHFALVYSNANPIGFVTLDNILQAITGEIKDEFNITKDDVIKLENDTYLIKGTAPIYVLEKLFGFNTSETEANTISGLILEKLQSFPKEGERIEFEKFDIVVEKISGPKIVRVHVYKKKEPTKE